MHFKFFGLHASQYETAGICVRQCRRIMKDTLCVFPHAEIHVSACILACISACGNISLEVEIYSNRASECSCTCGNMGNIKAAMLGIVIYLHIEGALYAQKSVPSWFFAVFDS